MWQKEDEEEVQWSKKSHGGSPSSSGPHPDYSKNLLMAQNFINRMEKSLLPGMNVAIRGSHGLDRSLLMISWTPPRHAKVGNWANPISLHQSNNIFARSLEFVFNDYIRRIESFEKNHKQDEPL